MKRLWAIALLLVLWGGLRAQDTLGVAPALADSLGDIGVGLWEQHRDTVVLTRTDTVLLTRLDTVYLLRVDTLRIRYEDTAALSALREKEQFYRQILSTNGVDKEKLEAERNHYIHMVDSLRALVRIAELENVRRDEANKYLAERARTAEARVAEQTNKKKKVRPIQGVALRFYRTPDWEIRLKGGAEPNTYEKYLSNRNAGNVEFDYVTGASVMLWDLTRFFNRDIHLGPDSTRRREIPRFDQQFSYDLGFYIGFGGSNLFKNFYVGLSFKFVDFFYLTAGVNIAEYHVLVDGYTSGDTLGSSLSIEDVTAKAWLVKPFVALNIDLDFLSLIKK